VLHAPRPSPPPKVAPHRSSRWNASSQRLVWVRLYFHSAFNSSLIWLFCSDWTEPAPGRNKEHDSTAAKSRYVPNLTIRIIPFYLTNPAAIVEMERATMPPAKLVCIFLFLLRASLTDYSSECLSRPQVDLSSTFSNGKFPSSVLP